MKVHFVGAGPGAADLMTLRGRAIIEASPVCLYAGSLVPPEVLQWCPADARVVDTAGMTLDQIVAEVLAARDRDVDVARLHSGDPSVFSAVAEQARRLQGMGVEFDITPGVPAFAAAAATLGRELTVPEVGQSVLLTRISARATAMPPGEDLPTLARTGVTLVLHLAVQAVEQVVRDLLPHYGLDCPVAVVARASRPDEVVLRGTLADIAAQVLEAGVRRTAVIVVGRVLAADGFPDSHLYSSIRAR